MILFALHSRNNLEWDVRFLLLAEPLLYAVCQSLCWKASRLDTVTFNWPCGQRVVEILSDTICVGKEQRVGRESCHGGNEARDQRLCNVRISVTSVEPLLPGAFGCVPLHPINMQTHPYIPHWARPLKWSSLRKGKSDFHFEMTRKGKPHGTKLQFLARSGIRLLAMYFTIGVE